MMMATESLFPRTEVRSISSTEGQFIGRERYFGNGGCHGIFGIEFIRFLEKLYGLLFSRAILVDDDDLFGSEFFSGIEDDGSAVSFQAGADL
jgi:hypothetical protein